MMPKDKMHTKAYRVYREEYINLWNFAAMICYAVPTLSKNIKGVEEKIPNYSMVKPDFLRNDRSSLSELKKRIKTYGNQLTSYLWLSNFAFFEAYIRKVLDELIEFHGGKELFLNNALKAIRTDISNVTDEQKKCRIKLQKPFDARKIDQYKKRAKKLRESGYRFPSELMAAYGVKNLIEKVNDVRAKDIPLLLQDAFLFDLDNKTLKTFISYKDKRNMIAHGESVKYSMYDTVGMFAFFKSLSFKIDQHLMHNFFINERYAVE